jgi:DUF4097 and DUF4098 domain-containing protein YvlB
MGFLQETLEILSRFFSLISLISLNGVLAMQYELVGFETIFLSALLFAFSAQKAAVRDDGREEARQSFHLSANPRIEVTNVNGQVIIQTSDSAVVEVEIVRQAKRQKDLKYHPVIVEHTPDSVIIQGKEDRAAYKRGIHVEQQVTVKIPRQASLTVKRIGGSLQIDELEGPLKIEQVSGPVRIGPVAGRLAVTGTSGDLRASVRSLDQIEIRNIGGDVELRFADALNAELAVKSIGGGVELDLPNVETSGQNAAISMTARIGAGGSQISILKVSGDVHLALGL